MRNILLTLGFLFLISPSCYADDVVVKDYYRTTFGNILKGSTQEQVKQILGEPKYFMADKNIDVWYYYFNIDSRLFVYFRNGKVIDVGNPTNKEG
ncbi:MAG: hypothetical protein UT30_C0038G0005 [Candidatus Uhrbacteria bacterium GW2011_GWF2_39_13]|uniref:Outer membrane protein assembly factor BamE domain-containing protein n=1 Tax=Candidatus Uhrbacteria bacterium GW2011_GWF2_39_13 TaxID=1618995 RepID=A0A0G0MGG8_9BACT|nr:MAG: hypothetical protein UT30_C0038G0005 [Candidatus Uhrbacteria bacterium GW2011_GWF2_39_13]